MDRERKKQLVEQYKEMKTEAGVYQIRNVRNGKCFVGSTSNLKSLNGKRFSLNNGTDVHKELQQEWTKYGEEAFEIEVLETIKPKDNLYYDTKDELVKLEEKWIDKLQPFGECGYNRDTAND